MLDNDFLAQIIVKSYSKCLTTLLMISTYLVGMMIETGTLNNLPRLRSWLSKPLTCIDNENRQTTLWRNL
jgi:hypothetical protein